MIKSKKIVSILLLGCLFVSAIMLACFAPKKAYAVDIVGGDTFIDNEMYNNHKDLELPQSKIQKKSVGTVASGGTSSGVQGGANLDQLFDNNTKTTWEALWAIHGTDTEMQIDFTFSNKQLLTGLQYITALGNNASSIPYYLYFQTSEDGTTYTTIPVNASTGRIIPQFILGTQNFYFDEAVFTKYFRIITDGKTLSEMSLFYVPTESADIVSMSAMVDTYVEEAARAVGLQHNTYKEADIKAYNEATAYAKTLPQTTDEERMIKGKAFFKIATDIKRGRQELASTLGELKNEARELLTAAVVTESDPLTWKQADVDILEAACAEAEHLIDTNDVWNNGIIYDLRDDLTKKIFNFRISTIKPELSQSGFQQFQNEVVDTNLKFIMDGITSNRLRVGIGAQNINGTTHILFDYKKEISFNNMKIMSWFAPKQSFKKAKLEYWNGTAFVPVVGAGITDGVFDLAYDGAYSNASITATINFDTISTSKFKFIPLALGGETCTAIDEMDFGVVVEPNDMRITLTPATLTMAELTKEKITANVTPFYASNKNVIWTSSDDSIASVDAKGIVTAKSTKGAATATVTITATTEHGAKAATCDITITKAEAKPADLEGATKRIEIQQKFLAKAKDADYKAGAKETFGAELTKIKNRIPTSSLGDLKAMATEVENLRADFDAKSLLPIKATNDLIDRIIGVGNSQKFIVEVIPKDAETGNDVFELGWSISDNKPVLRGNDSVSLATAFNYYLKYYCYQDFPYFGEYSIKLPTVLPTVNGTFRNVFPHTYRRYFNENCEYKYTVLSYTENEWYHRLDWMAMNGFNMYLFDFDNKHIWLEAGKAGAIGTGWDDGVKTEMLKSTDVHLTPDFGNYVIDESSLAKEKELAIKVMNRSFELGLEPEMRPFYGSVPFLFKNNHDDYYVNKSASFTIDLPNTVFDGVNAYNAAPWMGMPQGISISAYSTSSNPADKTKAKESYEVIGDIYYEYMQKVYPFDETGRTPQYFTKDLVQEQGFFVQHAAYPQEMLGVFSDDLKEVNPDMLYIMSSWRVQAWQFEYIDIDQTLVIDLQAEYAPKHAGTNQFYGSKWVWGMLLNFGGNTGLNFRLDGIANDPFTAKKNYNKMSGISINPEGGDTNPLAYALMAENAWRNEPVNVEQWLRDYAKRRYGSGYTEAKTEIDAAWNTMYKTVFTGATSDGPAQTIVNAFPYVEGAKARYWGSNDIPYSRKDAVPALTNMIAAANKMTEMTDGFKYDLVDIARQVYADLSAEIYGKISSSYKARNYPDAVKYAEMMVTLCNDMDDLLNTNQAFMLGRRLEGARGRGATVADKNWYEEIERTYLTIWVPDNTATGRAGGLIDYCNQHLGGLMKDYYGMRWQVLVDMLKEATALSSVPTLDVFKQTYHPRMVTTIDAKVLAWTNKNNSTNSYSTTPIGDTKAVNNTIYAKYLPIMNELYAISSDVNKNALTAGYNTYKDLTNDDSAYDSVLWANFQALLTQSKAVLDKADATQVEVNNYTVALKYAFDEMQLGTGGVNKVGLLAEYNAKKSLEKGYYSEDTWQALQDALASALVVYNNTNATAEEVDGAIKAITDAFAGLVEERPIIIPPADKNRLVNILEFYSMLKGNEYSEKSWQMFVDKYSQAKAVIDKTEPKQSEINTAYDELLAAYDSLERDGGKNVLTKGGVIGISLGVGIPVALGGLFLLYWFVLRGRLSITFNAKKQK